MTGPTPDPTSEIRMQVMWNRLISVVEEQAMTLLRTAFSTSVRAAGDLSAGVFDPEGRMLAQAVTGTPGHVNTMAEAVLHFIAGIGRENMFPGDTYVTNDPWKGTGHLHDITMISPSFLGDRLVGFFACTAHVVDVGGRGFGADGKSVYEEGIQIPILKFAERGVVNRVLVQMLHANVREPDQVVGDVYSLAACNDVGHRRLIAMLEKIGLTSLEGLGSLSNTLLTDGYDRPRPRWRPAGGSRQRGAGRWHAAQAEGLAAGACGAAAGPASAGGRRVRRSGAA